MKKIAIVLLNLGGPSSLSGVKPFLFNLFKDPNIIRLPTFARYPLAWLISTLRHEKAVNIYKEIGGKSPLNENTLAQVNALEGALHVESAEKNFDAKVFMCMRYAPPMTEEVLKKVMDFGPDEVVLLPLYPQFSTTTTKSSHEEWKNHAKAHNFNVKTHFLCCYPTENGFIEASRELLVEHLSGIPATIASSVRLLFSAHGLPKDIVDEGDPYAMQVELSMHAVMDHPLLQAYNYKLCYQSKVGPKKWLTPSLKDALEECKKDNVGAVIIPISFVSEHSETLVELDIQYKKWSLDHDLLHYSRIKTVSTHPKFIFGLKNAIIKSLNGEKCTKVCQKEISLCGYA